MITSIVARAVTLGAEVFKFINDKNKRQFSKKLLEKKEDLEEVLEDMNQELAKDLNYQDDGKVQRLAEQKAQIEKEINEYLLLALTELPNVNK